VITAEAATIPTFCDDALLCQATPVSGGGHQVIGKAVFGFGRKRLSCSFCGKDADSVEALLSGPKVFICNECVAVCNRILVAEAAGRPAQD
jgi:hypothetical protein